MNIIKENPQHNWFGLTLTLNPNITIKLIKNNPEIKWDFQYISLNQNITPEIIMNNPNISWIMNYILNNSMEKWKNEWINIMRLKIIKTFQIQRYWRNCTYNPIYKLAQNNISILYNL